MDDKDVWVARSALYEILALALRYPTDTLTDALSSGEFAEALAEIMLLNQLDAAAASAAAAELVQYQGQSADELLHALRREHTYLYVGAPSPAVSPYAGVWWAQAAGVEPLLFVNKESMAVERFMRNCGIGQPKGTNEPLDHIATECEFLHYLALVNAQVAKPQDDVCISQTAFSDFYATHFKDFAQKFANATIEHSRIAFYKGIAQVLAALM
jgi:TorA maturation chaperone TorD